MPTSTPKTPTLEERLRDPLTRREAFPELVREFSQPLYWQIRRLVQDHDDTNDLLQNLFIKVWQNLDLFRGEAKLSTWLHKIAINEALTHLQTQQRRATESLDAATDVDDEGHGLQIASDPWMDGDQAALTLRQAIASLPPKQQLVFNMKYFDEMKYEEISEITGTSIGALKASYHLAVKKIEEFIARH